MAYNPYDDVIDQDPAYVQEGGGTRTGLVQPVTTDQGPRYISSGIAKAYSLLTPEEETLQEIERLKKEGFELIHQSAKDGADNKLIAFLHPKSTNGLLVELCQEKN